MIVDSCLSVRPEQGVQVDTKPCRIKRHTPGENTFLNVNTPLLLGGRHTSPSYPAGITTAKFDGCVRNLVHNGKVGGVSCSLMYRNMILQKAKKNK
jgi:hypothetical protein